MLWTEVRKIYPDQWVLVEEIKSYEENDKIYVEEVAIIKPIQDSNEAMKELMSAAGDRFVYHTSKERIIMDVRMKPSIRRHHT